MGSEIYISDEGEASENTSMEMIEVSEDGGDEEYDSEHESYCADEEYESDHEAYNSTVIESPVDFAFFGASSSPAILKKNLCESI
ncbi:hypothetical protein L1887_32188 [Cichorium endivia]|nr:hypothetical protein L1887_32188 [Cichorium endivia]